MALVRGVNPFTGAPGPGMPVAGGGAAGNPLFGGGSGGWRDVMTNPLFHMGIGMLSQGASPYPINPFAGASQGLMNAGRMGQIFSAQDRAAAELQMRQDEMAMKREQMEEERTGRRRMQEIIGAPGSTVPGAMSAGGGVPRDATTAGSGLLGGEYDRATAANMLLGIPGQERTALALLQQEQSAAQTESTQAHREAVLGETVRHHQAVEAADRQKLSAARAAAEAKIAQKGVFDGEDVRATRGQYEIATRKDREAIKAYEALRDLSSAGNTSIAGDTALIFQFMKTLDPASTVREGEVATVENSAGIADRWRNMYNRAIRGESGLSQQQRQEIEAAARTAVTPRVKSLGETSAVYRDIAIRGGADPKDIVIYQDRPDLLEEPAWPTSVTRPMPAAPASPVTLIPGAGSSAPGGAPGPGGPVDLFSLPRR